MKLKIEELLGPRALRAFGIRADELKNIHLDAAGGGSGTGTAAAAVGTTDMSERGERERTR